MCNFFSFSTDAKGKYFYFKPEDIKKIRKSGNESNLDFNSHSCISEYYHGSSTKEDNYNKYEYNPFSKKFEVDGINLNFNDSFQAEQWIKNLFDSMNRKQFLEFYDNYRYKVDYKRLSKDLGKIPTKSDVIKLIKQVEKIDWFIPQKRPIKAKLQLKINSILKAFNLDIKAELEFGTLKSKEDWDSAWASARDSAWDSARASARDSAWASAFETVKDLMKKQGYKSNPFKKLLELWELGLYPCGIMKNKKFLIYYVPIKK